MDNSKLGRIGAAITGACVVAFALAMLIGLLFGLDTALVSYFVCIFIAIRYIMLTSTFIARNVDYCVCS